MWPFNDIGILYNTTGVLLAINTIPYAGIVTSTFRYSVKSAVDTQVGLPLAAFKAATHALYITKATDYAGFLKRYI